MKSVTIRDVAREAGVSIATVSRVLSGKNNVSEETRRQISQAIRQTGYQIPASADRSLLAEDSLIYYIMRTASTNVYSQLLNTQLVLAACRRDLRLVSANVEQKDAEGVTVPEEEILSHLRRAKRLGARGVILSGFSDRRMTQPVLDGLRQLGIPVVLIVRSVSDHSFNRVLTGAERGTFQAAQHMLDEGRRHLMFLTLSGHNGKRRGFERAVQEYGDPQLKWQVVVVPDDSASSCAVALEQALKTDPALDGVLCIADELAAHLLQTLQRMGKRVPQDVKLIGYNDNLAPFLNPPLSSIRVPLREIAETALDLIAEQERDPGAVCKSVLMDPQLILR